MSSVSYEVCFFPSPFSWIVHSLWTWRFVLVHRICCLTKRCLHLWLLTKRRLELGSENSVCTRWCSTEIKLLYVSNRSSLFSIFRFWLSVYFSFWKPDKWLIIGAFWSLTLSTYITAYVLLYVHTFCLESSDQADLCYIHQMEYWCHVKVVLIDSKHIII